MGKMAPAEGDGITHAEPAIHQEIVFAASPNKVYQMLTDTKVFDQVVRQSAAAPIVLKPGAPPTQIDTTAGGTFALFGGYVSGRQLELVPGQRLVEAWRTMSWPQGAYSVVTFQLKAEGSGTRVILDHKGFPADQAAHLAQGWHDNYWTPMGKVFAAH